MLELTSTIEGKRAYYGEFCAHFEKDGFTLCGGWEYDHAYMDAILYQQEGVTLYVRIPVYVVEGRLDELDALVEFGKPFLIKHVLNIGLTEDEDFSGLDAAGLNQFQKPLDPDDRIEKERRWQHAGELLVEKVTRAVMNELTMV